MTKLEEIAVEQIVRLAQESFKLLALLPLEGSNLNFNNDIFPISKKVNKIEQIGNVLKQTIKE